MSSAKIPSPADWDLDWPDVAMIVQGLRGNARLSALMNRFFITEKTAAAWLEGANHWSKQNRVAS